MKKSIFRPKNFTVILAVVVFLILCTACQDKNTLEMKSKVENTQETTTTHQQKDTKQNTTKDGSGEKTANIVQTKEAELHFINTGNSDAILIKQGNKAALIDGGDNDDEGRVVSYLKDNGVSELEYVFATHPHADHIGGLDAVVNSIAVKNVYVSNGDADNKTYSDFINAMANKGLYPSVPLLNSEFELGTSTFKVLSVANEKDLNNNSIVLLYTNGKDKVLLMGDAEAEIESKINPGKVDLIKIGHHGSHSGSTLSFINKISPKYAVILVGENNKYGHPHIETMDTLKSNNIEVHRSDECGNIIFKSTGNGLAVNCKKGDYKPGKDSADSSKNSSRSYSSSKNVAVVAEPKSQPQSEEVQNTNTVYANGGKSKSNKYHSSPTAHKMEGAIPMSESEAQNKGYVPCKKCF
ncbi:MBL fold metallo-hydrolase [Romboutsia maritimum]|uniref:MBL fold metallo-hydrolase n=1 Tax=Romboutsia maritimum TaxID=2020948 RepID=A0A371ITJ6_9FIRM|nr:ComEC/Rec2 family competence protein [Romboutsia maritimum]RDY23800.1 MBL fold metallo-hydrolase [Romboutsia maritimum]